MLAEAKILVPGYRRSHLTLDIKEINATTFLGKKRPRSLSWEDKNIDEEHYGVALKKGKFREHMEDKHVIRGSIQGESTCSIFGVFDGHCTSEAAQYAADNLHCKVESNRFFGVNTSKAIRESINVIDSEYIQSERSGGTTACVAVIDKGKLSVGNVGDTRALLIRKNNYEQLTIDHTTDDRSECERIEQSGGFIIPVRKVPRVQGSLNITRGIGDRRYKKFIISDSHTIDLDLQPEDKYLVLASDGLYNVLPNSSIQEIVYSKRNKNCGQIAEDLAQEAIDRGSRDNITAMVIELKHYYGSVDQVPSVQEPYTPKAGSKRFAF